MRVLVDTNILARHSQPDHELHGFAVSALERLRSDGHELRLVPQILYEYWAVATRPAPENGLGLTVEEAYERLEGFKRFFPLLRDERRIYELWEILVRSHRVYGKPTHDARLVAAMQRHGLTHVLTFNAEDFKRYPDIQILEPQTVAKT
jgi:predicted nucleic acid-binding protein